MPLSKLNDFEDKNKRVFKFYNIKEKYEYSK